MKNIKTNKDEFEICPISTAQTIIGGKWTLSILFHLRTRILRFRELNRLLPNLTQSTLTKELRRLEGYQLIKSKVYAEVPPKVELFID